MASEINIALLRRPVCNDPSEQRSDPFWEFGSFGVTGCHQRNLLNPRRAEELTGRRIAFAQGGDVGFKLVYLTAPVEVRFHQGVCELSWQPVEMPFSYEAAPLLINNLGETSCPSLIDELEGTARPTWVSRFASRFRSRRSPVSDALAWELEGCFFAARAKGAKRAVTYIDALPFPPPSIDTNRIATYRSLIRAARGIAERKPCATTLRPASKREEETRVRRCQPRSC